MEMSNMNTPKAKPKPSKEVLGLVKAAKAKSKAQRNLKRNDSRQGNNLRVGSSCFEAHEGIAQ